MGPRDQQLPIEPGRTLPSLGQQVDRLIELGVPRVAGVAEDSLRAAAGTGGPADSLLVLHCDHAPVTALAPLLERGGKRGFIVDDLHDVDDFGPIDGAAAPDEVAYLVSGLDRGDHLANRSPEEALPEIQRDGRTPLTLVEGIHWLLQQPEILERGHCFMTIGSRLRASSGRLDARVPAVWISNGTGRDGRHRRNAPKIGWCWAGNRHTWLGFASAATRDRLPR